MQGKKLVWIFVFIFSLSLVSALTINTPIANQSVNSSVIVNFTQQIASDILVSDGNTVDSTDTRNQISSPIYIKAKQNLTVYGYSGRMSANDGTQTGNFSIYLNGVLQNITPTATYVESEYYNLSFPAINMIAGDNLSIDPSMTAGISECGDVVSNPYLEKSTLGDFPCYSSGLFYVHFNSTAITNRYELFLINSTNNIKSVGNISLNIIASQNSTYSYNVSMYNLNVSTGLYYFSVNASSNANSNIATNTSGIFNLTTNALLNINATNYTGGSISNFSVSIKDLTTNLISNYSTTSGLVQADVIYGRSYNLTIDNSLYALNYSTKTISSYIDYFTTKLFPNNALNITIRKESDGSLLYGNTSISFVSDSGVVSYSSLNGTKIYSGLTADNYSLSFALSGYSNNNKRVNLQDRTFQNVDVYLNNGTDILFNFKTASGSSLADVEFNVFTVVNGTLVSINSVKSDITGKAQVSLESSKYYYFTANLTGYTIAPFSLNPVLFSSYDVVMTATGSGSQIVPSAQVVISPKAFYRFQDVAMSIQFISPYDSLVDYSYTITYPYSSLNGSGNEAHGESFSESFSLDNSTINSNLIVFFEYNLNNGVYYNKTITYPIIYTYSNRTWVNMGNNINKTTGQDSITGYFVGERVLIVTIIAVIMFGVGWLVGGAASGLIFAIIPILFFINSGFVPKQLYYVTLFFIVIYIISRGSDT